MIPIVVIAFLARGSRPRGEAYMPAIFAILIGFMVLSVIFVALRKNGMQKAANTVSLISCGILLLFLSPFMGLGEFFGWAGTVLIASGLILAMSLIVASPKKRFAMTENNLLPESVSHLEIKKLLDAMAFPSAFLKNDGNGGDVVVAINEALAAMLGKNNQQVRDKEFSSVLPGSGTAASFKFSGNEWVPNRTSRGNQTLFMLTPLFKAKEEFSGPTDAIDHETGLFTPLFLKYRANADVEACRRYGRKLSVILFRLSFDNMQIKPSDEAIKKAFAEFGKMAAASLRACDSGYRIREDEVLIFLPDTPQGGSKIVVSRILSGVRKLARLECVELGQASIDDVTINYFGEEASSVDQVMNDVYVEMGRTAELKLHSVVPDDK
jgi:GGDEF domain-containing protein